MATKQTTKRAARTGSAKPPRVPRGNISNPEIRALVLEAKDGLMMQIQLANIDPQTDFDTWRREEVMKAVGKGGTSALDSEDFNAVMAHFAELAGHDEKAMEHSIKAGKAKDHGDPDDTHAKRAQLAAVILDNLRAHIRLADAEPVQLAAETIDTDEYQRLRAARAAIQASGKGPIREGYLVALVKQKTRRPNLTLGRDLQAGLAERCTVRQLAQILATLRNRISTREGRANAEKRAPGTARRKAAKKAKEKAIDTPAGTASRLAKPSPNDPF